MDGITDSTAMSLSKLQEMVKDRKPGVLLFTGLQRVRYDSVNKNKKTESVDTLQKKGI